MPNLNSTVVYEATIKNNFSSPKVVSAITNKVAGNTSISYTYDYKINTVIAANSTTKILFTFKYNSGITSLPSNQIKECTISLTFEDAKFPLYDKIQELSANSSNYIKKYTGDTNTFTGNKSVYYYYGKAENNNVLFANYCWKIVRTTDTGGVKLLYNGVPSNGALAYPVGLLAAPEANIARDATDSTSPLSSGKDFWTMTPYYLYLGNPCVQYVAESGSVHHYMVNNRIGVRPAVSLKTGSAYSSGDGTSTSPYIIHTS